MIIFSKKEIAAIIIILFVTGSAALHIYALDDVPPKISKISVSGVSATTASIVWFTDEESDSTVNYGLSEQHGISRDPRFVSPRHEVVLDDLLPSTVYHFRVVSLDKAANQSIESGFTFVTKAIQEIQELADLNIAPQEQAAVERAVTAIQQLSSQVSIELVAEKLQTVAEEVLGPPKILGKPRVTAGSTDATIEWFTDVKSNSLVDLASEAEFSPGSSRPYTITQGQSDDAVTDHKVTVIGLEPATTYHFRVTSKQRVGPAGRTEDDVFTTKAFLPEIRRVSIEKVEEDSATISLLANIPVSIVVEYINTRTNERNSKGNPTFLPSHTIRLDDLQFATTYEAVVIIENLTGDKARSQQLRFTTVRDEFPPIISKVTNESTLFPGDDIKIQTIIAWETDEPATCQFFFQEGIAPGVEPFSAPEEADPTQKHVQVITSLGASSVYKFWLACRDRTGNPSRSEDFVLVTPEKEKSIIDIIIENFEGSFGWVKNIGA